MKKLIYVLVLGFVFSSCLTTRTNVGKFQELPGRVYTFDKAKQFWLLWGLLPVGGTSAQTPSDGDCRVITHFTFADFIISGITGGIVTSYSIKVQAKENYKTSE